MTTAEWRKRLKAAHICLDCGQQDAYTLNGYTYCHDCNEKRNRKAAEYRRTKQDELRDEMKQRYWNRVSNCLCAYCGKPKKWYEHLTNCSKCAAVKRNKMNAANAPKRRRLPGVCYQCCNKPPMPGKKVCEDCYAVCLRTAANARAHRTEEQKRRLMMTGGKICRTS